MQKRVPYRNKKVRDAARGESCTMQSGVCNNNSETTVFAHLNVHWAGKGTGQKADDIGMFLCSSCHDMYDGRCPTDSDWLSHGDFYIYRALYRTLRRLLDLGVLK